MTIDLANILDRFFASQNTRNGISEHQAFKMYGESMSPEPPRDSPLQRFLSSSVIIIRFYILKKSDSLSVLTWCRQETLITYYTQRSTHLKEKIGYTINKKQQISKLTFY